eukprot:CAMPEP_0182865762 /NCGR_PEP_ID=MMETSP0034_2-20130328/7861_1 /TAXON_ID=156128 /ORGANISM="Nephroselmis pyriformis, Strain CCMP717" /LENGTH=285 /DNA_ID=CAMNT_0024998079 /DNA_START=149 /DNA_END=1003 /DNA_ORIENTATION=+
MGAETLESSGDGAPWLYGCMIVSNHSSCLINCMMEDLPGGGVNVQSLCNLVIAMQGLAGGHSATYLTLGPVAVAAAGGESFVVVVLCAPGRHKDSALLRATQVAHIFEKAFPDALTQRAQREAKETEHRMHSYTVRDEIEFQASGEGAGAEHATLPEFAAFEAGVLRGVLAAAPYGDAWMGPLHGVAGVLGAYLVSPTARDPLLLEPLPQLQPPPPGGTGSGGGGCVVDARLMAGPSGGAVWEAAMTHAAMLFSPRPPSPSPEEGAAALPPHGHGSMGPWGGTGL